MLKSLYYTSTHVEYLESIECHLCYVSNLGGHILPSAYCSVLLLIVVHLYKVENTVPTNLAVTL